MDNTFSVKILADGKIVVDAPGGFGRETHADADEFLAMIKALGGGDVQVKQHKPNLANPHGQQQYGNYGHRH